MKSISWFQFTNLRAIAGGTSVITHLDATAAYSESIWGAIAGWYPVNAKSDEVLLSRSGSHSYIMIDWNYKETKMIEIVTKSRITLSELIAAWREWCNFSQAQVLCWSEADINLCVYINYSFWYQWLQTEHGLCWLFERDNSLLLQFPSLSLNLMTSRRVKTAKKLD